MPPRRRTFYLADATVLSNSKVRGLARDYPRDWLAAWGAFHVLIGGATLNGSPRLSSRDLADVLGPEHADLLNLLRRVGLLTRSGIDPDTFEEWCPKPRPRYPSDDRGNKSDSDGITSDSDGVGRNSAEKDGVPTSSSSSSSPSKAASSSSSRGVGSAKDDDGLKAPRTKEEALHALSERFQRGELSELEYSRQRKEIA
jgi:hypothetical protein